MSKIFEKLERRGEDAAGFWATQKGEKGAVYYHKEPVKSTEFVCTSSWSEMCKFNPNLLLLHARAATPGVGVPSVNKNNHPFVSEDFTLSIIHNGKLPEYHFLKDKYETLTNCDSELVLRILQCQNDLPPSLSGSDHLSENQKNRLSGIGRLWSLSCYAHMAVGVGEWFDDGTRQLWLWRNTHRPLWVADMRSTLGQIIFFSEDYIWLDAVKESPLITKYLHKQQKMYEMPTEEVWFFEVNEKNSVVTEDLFQKFDIVKKSIEGLEEDEVSEGVPLENKKNSPSKLICKLGKDDEPLEKTNSKKDKKPVTDLVHYKNSIPNTYNNLNIPYKQTQQKQTDVWRDRQYEKNNQKYDTENNSGMHTVYPYYKVAGVADVEDLCEEIKNITSEIATDLLNQSMEGSITEEQYQELLDQLESTKIDLNATYQILSKSVG